MCSSFHWSFLGGLLRCSSSLHCVFIGQVSCSLSSAQAKGRDVVNQAGDACITSFPCATATVLCSLWQEPSQVSQHSSLGKRNNVHLHLQFARPTLNAYCSTKCAFVKQIGLTGKHTGQILRTLWKCSSTNEYWPTFSNSNRHYCDHHMFHFVWQLSHSPNVGASISRWQLGNYRPQYHCDWRLKDGGCGRSIWPGGLGSSWRQQVHWDQT